jgi:outer membrane lipoprotein-sorting protein
MLLRQRSRHVASRVTLAGLVAAGWIGASARLEASDRPTPGRCATPVECLAEVTAAQSGVRSIAARFKQTKRVALLREPLVSSGRFTFTRPDRVRWEVLEPAPFVVEIAGSRLRVGEGGELHDVEAGGAAGVFSDLAGIFTGEGLGKGFAVSQGPEGRYSFRLEPRRGSLSRTIASLDLIADPETHRPKRAVIREPGGDVTEVELFDAVVNQAPPGQP